MVDVDWFFFFCYCYLLAVVETMLAGTIGQGRIYCFLPGSSIQHPFTPPASCLSQPPRREQGFILLPLYSQSFSLSIMYKVRKSNT